MAYKRKVKIGGFFQLPDGSVIKNESERPVVLVRLSKEEFEIVQKENDKPINGDNKNVRPENK